MALVQRLSTAGSASLSRRQPSFPQIPFILLKSQTSLSNNIPSRGFQFATITTISISSNGNSKYNKKSNKNDTQLSSGSRGTFITITQQGINLIPQRNNQQMKIGTGKQVRLRMFLSSPGQIADPYVPPTSFPSILSRAGLGAVWQRVKNLFQTWYSLRRTKKVMLKEEKKSFSKGAFLNEAKNIYIRMNEALANGDVTELKNLTTDHYLTELKGLINNKPKQLKTVWKADDVRSKVIAARSLQIQSSKYEFTQVTVRFDSRQSLAIYDRQGHLKAGDEEKLPVTDFCVFERSLLKGKSDWKLCGKIDPNNPVKSS